MHQMNDYWKALDVLVDSSAIEIDRPRGSEDRENNVSFPALPFVWEDLA